MRIRFPETENHVAFEIADDCLASAYGLPVGIINKHICESYELTFVGKDDSLNFLKEPLCKIVLKYKSEITLSEVEQVFIDLFIRAGFAIINLMAQKGVK